MTALLLVLAGCSEQKVGTFNSLPDAQITSPEDGSAVRAGAPLTLRGAASDADDPSSALITRWFVGDEEACAAAAPAEDGTTTCDVTVPSDSPMEIRLEVADADGAASTASIRLDVTPNAGPTAGIASPLADGTYHADQLVTFRGTLADAEDAPELLTAWWEDGSTRLDAVEATPTTEGEVLGYMLLSEGAHALELHVRDTMGGEGFATVLVEVGPPNAAPECEILSPATDGLSETGQRVDFTAEATDADIPANQLSVTWDSDKDGFLGTSTPDSAGAVAFSTADLSANTHRITMTVTDEVGATCARAITWTVNGVPSAPAVSLVPENPTTRDDLLVRIDTAASDPDGGAVTYTYVWSVDGAPSALSTTDTLPASVTTHGETWTVAVTASDGLASSPAGVASATIVNSAPTAPVVEITPGDAVGGDALTCAVIAAGADDDGDALVYAFGWDVDGAAYTGAADSATDSVVGGGDVGGGQTWTCSVFASDGTVASPVAVAAVSVREGFVDYTTADGSDMVAIVAGTVTMSNGNTQVATLTHDFWIGRTELTQDAWLARLGTNPAAFPGCGSDCPVEQVSWVDAALYANALSAAEGLAPCYTATGSDLDPSWGGDPYACEGYRLPTEAEWEYAAKAGSAYTYAGSDTADDVAWTAENSGGTTHVVAGRGANAWGLYDMSGNVWEWNHDWYAPYVSGAVIDPAGPSVGTYRMWRGGSWNYGASAIALSVRSSDDPSQRLDYLGFRLSRTAPAP